MNISSPSVHKMKCDRCGTETHKDSSWSVFNFSVPYNSSMYAVHPFDLCERCSGLVKALIDNKVSK